MNYTEFADKFAGQKPCPVYLFTGEEQFFIDQGVRMVTDRFLEKGKEAFNYDLCSASDIAVSQVIGMAETLPAGAEYRVLIVKGVDQWSSKEREQMLSYMNNPSPTTCLILTASKLDRREKFSAAAEKSGRVIHCRPLYRKEVAAWLKNEISGAGKQIEQDALTMLAENGGEDLLILKQDIEKLILYCGDKKTVTLRDAANVSSCIRSISIFELVNAISERRLEEAFVSLKKILADGEPPVRIFYFIVRECRIMLKARIMIEEGQSPEEAAKKAGVPGFKIREFSQRIRKFSRNELSGLFEKLMKVDEMLKGGSLRPQMVLEDFILSVCRKS